MTALSKDVETVKETPGLKGNYGSTDISAGNITSSKTIKTSNINIDGDIISKYVTGNETTGLKLSNGKTDITYDTSGKVNFGDVKIESNGDVTFNGSVKFGTVASLNDKGTLNLNQLTVNNTKNGFSSSGDVFANKASFSSLEVGNNINLGKVFMFSSFINGGSSKSVIGSLPAGITITNINVSGKLTEGLKAPLNFFQSAILPPYNFKISVPGFNTPSVSFTVPSIGLPFSYNLVPTVTTVTQNSNLELEPVFSNGNIIKHVFNPLTVVITYTSASLNSIVYNGDLTGNIGFFNNIQSNLINTQSSIIHSSGGTFTSSGKSGLVIQGDANNWVLGEVQGTLSKTKRLCLSLNDKPLVCVDPTNRNLMDGAKDW